MTVIYMDNAATSFPKPGAVTDAMVHYANDLGASPGRGAYAGAQEVGKLMNQCRGRINQLVNGPDAHHIIFTLNTTDSLNQAIKGIVGYQLLQGHFSSAKKPHVITTYLDHNSILRPFNALVEQGAARQTRVKCDSISGLVSPDDIKKAITPQTVLIAVVHGSNVTGTLQPVAEIGKIAREYEIPFVVDAAQTMGHFPIDVQRDCIDLLAFPGHKGLLGPLGTGGLYIRPGLEKKMITTREGGTGSISEQDIHPEFMPDKFEAGSHNAIGILGLSEGVKWILDKKVENIWLHEQELIQAMLDGLSDLRETGKLKILGPQGKENRCGVFSVRLSGFDKPLDLSNLLEKDFGLLTRSGIHCAPLAHQTIGTHHLGGTTRFSFGPFLTEKNVQYACDALEKIASGHEAFGNVG